MLLELLGVAPGVARERLIKKPWCDTILQQLVGQDCISAFPPVRQGWELEFLEAFRVREVLTFGW